MGRFNANRRRRYSARARELREQERRHAELQPALEPVVPHEPPHETGCLRCFVARGQEHRGDRSGADR